MLNLELTRAMAPDEMEPRPCGICGAGFTPRPVLCNLVTAHEYLPTCEACIDHLAERAEREDIPAEWGEVVRAYRLALEAYPSPVCPTVDALLEADRLAGDWTSMSWAIDPGELITAAEAKEGN